MARWSHQTNVRAIYKDGTHGMNARDRQIHAVNAARILRERDAFAERLGLKAGYRKQRPDEIDAAFIELLSQEQKRTGNAA
jgi:hypothetical protein